MKRICIPLLFLSLVPCWAGLDQLDQQPPESTINALMNKYYRAQAVTPESRVDDETFLRRAFLEIAGRIPTYKEATRFYDDETPYKREALIDELLDSDAYTSHMFNWWADLLRVKSRLSNQVPGGTDYINWIKSSVADNMAYDEMVYALITAEGYPRDNPAVGYYLRDTGMPLDNMANTAQVFLGTQLQCAQCHDHPFDKWTQKEFYELAAHTFNVQTRIRPQENPEFSGVLAEVRKERIKSMGSGDMQGAQPDRAMFRAFQEIFSPFSFGAIDTRRGLTLPDDYQYDNAKPGQRVNPKVPFGDEGFISAADSSREVYANWIISPDNPRFTKIIANRMWKKTMGRGLFEPVDDYTDETEITHPELMDHLTALMIDLDYDLKEFLRVLYKTDLFQREKNTKDIQADETWHFAGPVMHRMSAEQIWDSMMTLAVEDLDTREGPDVRQRYDDQEVRAKSLKKKSAEEIITMAKDLAALENETVQRQGELRKQAQEINDPDERRKFGREQFKYAQERRARTNAILGISEEDSDMMMNGSAMTRSNRGGALERALVRASELPSPSQPGTFLRQFGQSDREVIENANADASIPQVLAMMNGQFSQNLLNPRSLLSKTLQDSDDTIDAIDRLFLSILSRMPDAEEKLLMATQLKKRGKQGLQDITWALVNTQQFVFVP